MIEYVDHQLNRWAAWLVTGNQRLGYPTRAAFVGAMGGGSGVPALPDDQAMIVNRAVAALPPLQHQVVELVYRKMRSCPAEAIARELHCTRETVYNRLHRAHVLVMESMQDEAIAAPRQSILTAQIDGGRAWRAKIA